MKSSRDNQAQPVAAQAVRVLKDRGMLIESSLSMFADECSSIVIVAPQKSLALD